MDHPVKRLGQLLLLLSTVALLLAIWSPRGWRWLLTGLFLLVVAAAILGRKN